MNSTVSKQIMVINEINWTPTLREHGVEQQSQGIKIIREALDKSEGEIEWFFDLNLQQEAKA